MGINKTTNTTVNGNTYEYVSLYADEIDNPGIYQDDEIASTDYVHDHDTIQGSSQWNNQITTGLKIKFFDVLNNLLAIFGTHSAATVSSEDEEEEEINLAEGLPTHVDDPAETGDTAVDSAYNKFWELFPDFLTDEYLGTVPDLFAPYALYAENEDDAYLAKDQENIKASEYQIWNDQAKNLQHIICKNLTSYSHGGFVNGNYSDDGCAYGSKANGSLSNGWKSNIYKTNGNNTNGTTYVFDSHSVDTHRSSTSQKSNGALYNGYKENGKKTNGTDSNGTNTNSTCYEGVETGSCGAQGPRYINVLCHKRTCAQTCTTYASSGINYSEEEVEAFLNS